MFRFCKRCDNTSHFPQNPAEIIGEIVAASVRESPGPAKESIIALRVGLSRIEYDTEAGLIPLVYGKLRRVAWSVARAPLHTELSRAS